MAAPVLSDPVPGNIGLLPDEDTVILLDFAEPDGVKPTDSAGTLEDLGAANVTIPSVDSTVAWASAVSRNFTGAAFLAADKAGASSLLTRDVSVQWIGAFSALTDNDAAYWTIISRGRGTGVGASEFVSYGVRVDPSFATLWFLTMFWMDLSGAETTVSSDGFAPPPVNTPTLFTVTRRWVSSTSVVVRFYIGDTLISEETSAAGTIGGGASGQTSIGGRRLDPTWTRFLDGWIDDLKVVSREMSHEEIKETWARLSKHQPDGVVALRGQSPPGAIWARNDGSNIGRLFKAAGQSMGFAAAKAHELRNTFLPDAAYKDTIGRWETLVGLQQREQLALDTRRDRVVSRLQVENGYSPPKVRALLAIPFAQADAAVDLREFSPTITEGFATLEAERWHVEGAGWSIVAGALQYTIALGADLRWNAMPPVPSHIRLPVDEEEGLIVQVKLVTYWVNLPANAIVGLFLYNRRTNDALWFGVKNDGGTRKLGWVAAKDGVLGAFTTIITPSTDAAYYLRITRTSSGTYLLYWSTVSFTAGTTIGASATITDIEHAGVAAMCTDATTAATLTATFDDFLARIPQGKRAFRWFAYRDPGDPGSPDMESADRIVQRVKPAHTEAAAVSSLSTLCDSDLGRCDLTPLGAL